MEHKYEYINILYIFTLWAARPWSYCQLSGKALVSRDEKQQ
jgi:hypothetical protein